ncbi:MAG: pyridoxal-phosphate dependent enzyme [bacterium]|nr:pyridoxal-phosphate dependent enzyme [bacterium]
MDYPPTIRDIQQAAERIKPFIHHTPIFTCSMLNKMCDARLFFKCENFQKIGAFKVRGACNTIFSLSDEEASRGVGTHSSGNHAAAVAFAAHLRGIKAYVVMPKTAPDVKRTTATAYGAEITLCEPTLTAREKTMTGILEATGATLIHSYNDYRVMTGHGTVALELCKEIPDLDIVIAPVGGGGLLSGTAIAVSEISDRRTQIIAAEPENADDAYRSLQAGKIIPVDNPQTIADGLRIPLGKNNFPIIQKYVSEIVTVSEEAIIQAMYRVWDKMKIIIEPSSAVPVAALLSGKMKISGKKVGVILTGGNVDLTNLPWLR